MKKHIISLWAFVILLAHFNMQALNAFPQEPIITDSTERQLIILDKIVELQLKLSALKEQKCYSYRIKQALQQCINTVAKNKKEVACVTGILLISYFAYKYLIPLIKIQQSVDEEDKICIPTQEFTIPDQVIEKNNLPVDGKTYDLDLSLMNSFEF